jgi:hypothetical protein
MADLITLYREELLPRLELIMHPARPEIILGKNSKPKATGRTIQPMVELRTFPAYLATSSPDRLRAIARHLEAAALTLEQAHAGQYPLGLTEHPPMGLSNGL